MMIEVKNMSFSYGKRKQKSLMTSRWHWIKVQFMVF